MSEEPPVEQLLREFDRDRWFAHERLFRHRHPSPAAPAHRELVAAIHSDEPRVSIEGFRGFAKSTYLEEAAVLRAGFRQFRHLLILGASYTRACERLNAIKTEFVNNDFIRFYFQPDWKSAGCVWQEGRIVFFCAGVRICMQAVGRNQSMLGVKWEDIRPDAFMVDDIEDAEEKRTDVERQEDWDWLQRTFLPALDDALLTWGRYSGTRRGTGSVPERLEKEGIPVKKFPIEYVGENGERVATWPSRRSLEWIDANKKRYRGDMHIYLEEYMCQASSSTDRVFTRDMLKVEPWPRSWQSVYVMYDPARTAHGRSATTGKAVWSWIRHRLVFWQVSAETWLPDQIIDDIFKVNAEFAPTWIGFEEDGLNEWAKQPIRAEMVKRRSMLPLLPVRAPRGKLQFIGGLQPFMHSGEVSFSGSPSEFADAFDQFVSYPRGRIDAPNACAYALMLRPGAPIYEDFADEHVSESLRELAGRPLYLAANSDGAVVTAALVQRAEGEMRVLADWVREGAPADVVGDIHAEAALAAETDEWSERIEYGDGENMFKVPVRVQVRQAIPIRWIVPAWHGETYRNVGLMQAARHVPVAISLGGSNETGRVNIAAMLRERRQGLPRLLVAPAARWTLRGFAGGYARELGARGVSAAQSEAGIYRLLMEGLESFAAVGSALERDREEDRQPMALDRRGVAYKSAMPARR